MKHFRISKKLAVSSLALAVVIVAGGVAYAFFTSAGNGSGSATVGSVSPLSITQVGAAYDSLSASGNYVQDQTYGGAGVTQFGNEVNLATTGELSDVVVAFRNWGPAETGVPITFNIYSPGDLSTPIASDTLSATLPAALTVGADPSTFNLSFDFSSQDVTLPSQVVYGISYSPSDSDSSSLNVALSSSSQDISVGSDVTSGYVWVSLLSPVWVAGWQVDAGTCSTPTETFAPVYVWCGANSNPGNPGAYENSSGADIPAVEFNVVGGGLSGLYPGAPAQAVEYAITNPSKSQQVNTVTVSIPSYEGYVETTAGDTNSAVSGCDVSWFQLNNDPQTLNTALPDNSTTIFDAATQLSTAGNVMSIQMINVDSSQDACEGITIPLQFSSN